MARQIEARYAAHVKHYQESGVVSKGTVFGAGPAAPRRARLLCLPHALPRAPSPKGFSRPRRVFSVPEGFFPSPKGLFPYPKGLFPYPKGRLQEGAIKEAGAGQRSAAFRALLTRAAARRRGGAGRIADGESNILYAKGGAGGAPAPRHHPSDGVTTEVLACSTHPHRR